MVEKNPLVHWIVKRIDQNKNAIIVINGETGSGKTFAAMDLAQRIAKMTGAKFSAHNNVDFSFIGLKKKMMMSINKGKGTPFVFEEVGAISGGAASREWQSKANNFFFSFMQTGRHLNQIIIMTCPQFAYLDKGVRQMAHVQITMTGINHKTSISYGKPFILQTNAITGKMYFKYLRYKTAGIKSALGTMTFNLPPTATLEEYESMKNQFSENLTKLTLEAAMPKKKPLPHNKVNITSNQVREYKDKGLSYRQLSNLFQISLGSVHNLIHSSK